jgi:hypothetical protein
MKQWCNGDKQGRPKKHSEKNNCFSTTTSITKFLMKLPEIKPETQVTAMGAIIIKCKVRKINFGLGRLTLKPFIASAMNEYKGQ